MVYCQNDKHIMILRLVSKPYYQVGLVFIILKRILILGYPNTKSNIWTIDIRMILVNDSIYWTNIGNNHVWLVLGLSLIVMLVFLFGYA
jgi:hypothetical protein